VSGASKEPEYYGALIAFPVAMARRSSALDSGIPTRDRGSVPLCLRRRAPGQVTFAPSLPGDITDVEVRGDLLVQSGSFLAGDAGVDIDIKWGGAKTFFSSEGLFLLHLKGQGQVLLSSFGAIHRIPLDGNSMIVDTGHVVAFDSQLDYRVKKVAGMFTSLISGEGLVCEFSGKGELWLQTRSNQAFLDWLLPRLPTAHTSSGGRGNIGGIIGNVLRGE